MPSSNTITAFYSFTGGTKAQSAQVNSNFDIFRGHFLPVDPTAAAAATNTYDIGSSNYYWRVGYVNKINFRGPTTTSDLLIEGNTSSTFGSLDFKIGGTARYSFGNVTHSSNLISGGRYEFRLAGSTITTLATTTGISLTAMTVRGFTTTASGSHIGRTAFWSYSGSTTVATTVNIPGSTLTVETTEGRPVWVGLMCGNTTTSLRLSCTSKDCRVIVQLKRDSTLIQTFNFREVWETTTAQLEAFSWPCCPATIDIPGAGTFNYYIAVTIYSGNATYLAGHTVAYQF